MTVFVFIGTRPEWIKCAPLFVNPQFQPIFVAQQKELLPEHSGFPTILINEFCENRLSNLVASILVADVWSKAEGVSAVLVQGDTAVAYAAAVAAFHRGLPVIHLEAGLRTRNLAHPWPEEGYRKMVDGIAAVALCPSKGAAAALKAESYGGQITIVGNTSIDAIAKYGLKPRIGTQVVVTLHRRENWALMREWFIAVEALAQKHVDLEFVIPVHPNPVIKDLADEIFKSVKVVPPLPHEAMCRLLADCNCVISDSGGIQEEAAFLGKRVFCCRVVTERDELVPTYVTLVPSPQELDSAFVPQHLLLPSATVYGCGEATEKIFEALGSFQGK
jgi:UDP-N-acetylglucosamine 2-epimerase (non-hydrolysing)